ncbi:alpha/beta hydrolase [Nonomuraea sp. NPDC050153]|uniref:alpha/beta hydrolase n=1 Tax=Nonomuraea sp. NPDC050153 TaxID=3364359 RepID=UPI00379D52FD
MLRNLLLAGLVTVGALVLWPGPPSGRLVRVYGDLATADRVAIIVPGADTTVATFDDGTKRPGGAARALLAEATRLAPGERLAVVAWLGYDSPRTLSLGVITSDAAVKGARELRRTVTDLHARTPAPIALLCHSYGSVLCARAIPGLPVADLAVFGSPGLDTPSATALTLPAHAAATLAQPAHATATPAQPAQAVTTQAQPAQAVTIPAQPAHATATPAQAAHAADTARAAGNARGATGAPSAQGAPVAQGARHARGGAQSAQDAASPRVTPPSAAVRSGAQGGATAATAAPLRVWAGLGESDWVRFVLKVKIGPAGFGADPMSPSFGARVFAVGSGGHSDYFTPGTPSLRNLTLIALGHAGEVTS